MVGWRRPRIIPAAGTADSLSLCDITDVSDGGDGVAEQELSHFAASLPAGSCLAHGLSQEFRLCHRAGVGR